MTTNRLYRRSTPWALTSPLLIFLLLIAVFPITYGLYTAFESRTLLGGAKGLVGLGNFRAVVGDAAFWHAIAFTAVYTVVTVGIEIVLGLGVALLFNSRIYARRILYTAMLLPIFIAPALMAVLWRLALNPDIGIVAAITQPFGINFTPYSGNWALVTVVVADVFQWLPLVFLICNAGLQAVQKELTEAAQLDGANYWRVLWHIIFPQIRPMIAIAAFLRLVDGAKTFDIIYVLTGGGPGTKTTTASIYIYREAFVQGNFGTATAASVIFLLLMLLLVPIVIRQTLRR